MIIGSIMMALAIVLPICSLGALIAFLVWLGNNVDTRDWEGFHIPLPWSVHARVRRRKAEVLLARADTDLYEVKHSALQREIVYDQLLTHKSELSTRALTPGN